MCRLLELGCQALVAQAVPLDAIAVDGATIEVPSTVSRLGNVVDTIAQVVWVTDPVRAFAPGAVFVRVAADKHRLAAAINQRGEWRDVNPAVSKWRRRRIIRCGAGAGSCGG